jgi:hypothetical protein
MRRKNENCAIGESKDVAIFAPKIKINAKV